MFGRQLLFDESKPSATFVNAAHSPAAGTITKPTGVANGQLAIITTINFPPLSVIYTSSGSAWNTFSYFWSNSYAYETYVWYKILNSTDVSNDWVNPNASQPCLVVLYSNVASIALKTSNNNGTVSSNTLNLGNFTPNTNSRGVVTIASDRDVFQPIVQPSTFTTRIANGQVVFASMAIADKLTGYSGENISWANTLGPSGFDEAGFVIELLGS